MSAIDRSFIKLFDAGCAAGEPAALIEPEYESQQDLKSFLQIAEYLSELRETGSATDDGAMAEDHEPAEIVIEDEFTNADVETEADGSACVEMAAAQPVFACPDFEPSVEALYRDEWLGDEAYQPDEVPAVASQLEPVNLAEQEQTSKESSLEQIAAASETAATEPDAQATAADTQAIEADAAKPPLAHQRLRVVHGGSSHEETLTGPHTAAANSVRAIKAASATASARGAAAPESLRFEPPADFQPQLQVDRFRWSQVAQRISEVGIDGLSDLAEELHTSEAVHGHTLAVASVANGDGATSVLLALARCLSRQGRRVAVVDGNLARPQLAPRLGLKPPTGWEEVVHGELPLQEAVIESIEDHIAVVPIVNAQPAEPLLRGPHFGHMLNTLRGTYDLVLVDAGQASGEGANAAELVAASHFDSVVLVRDARRQPHEASAAEVKLTQAGADLLGIIENFSH